jgi:hypothetical protein
MDDKCLVVHIKKIVESYLIFFSFASSTAKIKSKKSQTKDKFNLAVTWTYPLCDRCWYCLLFFSVYRYLCTNQQDTLHAFSDSIFTKYLLVDARIVTD